MGHYIFDAIRERIESDQSGGSLYDAIEGRHFERIVPFDTPNPSLRYALITDPIVARLSKNAVEAEVQFDVFADQSEQSGTAADINALLLDLFDRKPLSIDGFNGGQSQCLDRGRPIAQDDVDRIMSRYRIWANE